MRAHASTPAQPSPAQPSPAQPMKLSHSRSGGFCQRTGGVGELAQRPASKTSTAVAKPQVTTFGGGKTKYGLGTNSPGSPQWPASARRLATSSKSTTEAANHGSSLACEAAADARSHSAVLHL